jgi:isopentenyl diphosphate isomerase/L-lactate dehydrogenase-like FMN-dependent dehydrogenase
MKNLITLQDYEDAARDRLQPAVYDYYAGGADDEVTLRANRTAFERIRLRPRVLVDVSTIDMQTTVLGTAISMPILVAPAAYAGLAHDDAECGIVQAVGRLETIAVLSINASQTLETIAEAARPASVWQQLYLYDRSVTQRLLSRIKDAGYRAIVLTVDRPRLGRREREVRHAFHLPTGIQAANFVGSGITPRNGECLTTWSDIDWLREYTSLPLLLKGILHPADARLAVEHGVDGIIVSNHGGRQLDSALAAIEALPAIVEAVDGRCEVYVDGGIRRGTDVLKALALGARAVLIGRPILWGLAVDGSKGAERVLTILRDELALAMALCGCPSLAQINEDMLAERQGKQ